MLSIILQHLIRSGYKTCNHIRQRITLFRLREKLFEPGLKNIFFKPPSKRHSSSLRGQRIANHIVRSSRTGININVTVTFTALQIILVHMNRTKRLTSVRVILE
jgi:hypothetical protein